MRCIITICCLLIALASPAQSWEWATTFGAGNGCSMVTHSALDQNDNSYTSVLFFDSTRVNGYTISQLDTGNFHESVIVKSDANNSFLWMKCIPGGDVVIQNLETDQQNNLYVAGSFLDSISIDNHLFIADGINRSFFLCKLNPQGALLWLKHYSGISLSDTRFLFVNSDNEILIDIQFQGTICMDGDTFQSTEEWDGLLLRLSPNGQLLSSVMLTGSDVEYFYQMVQGNDGSYYVTGTYGWSCIGMETYIFQVGNMMYDASDNLNYIGFVVKLDSLLRPVWIQQVPAGNIAMHNTTISLGGAFKWDVIYVNTIPVFNHHQYNFDALLVQMDTSGMIFNAISWGSNSDDFVTSLVADASGNLYATCTFRDSIWLPPVGYSANLSGTTHTSSYVMKMTPNGAPVWYRQICSISRMDHIEIGSDASIYISGEFSGISFVDQNYWYQSTAGDGMICKLAFATDISSTETHTTLQLYPNPATEFIQVVVPDDKWQTIRIIDMNGKSVHAVNNVGMSSVVVDVSMLPKGHYFVELIAEETILRSKFIRM